MKKSNYFFVVGILFITFLNFNNIIRAEIKDEYSNNIHQKYGLKKESNLYLLDSGDVLFIDFLGLKLFSNRYPVDNNGNIFLPEIGYFSVKDKTLEQVEKNLLQIYKDIIIEPNIKVLILNYRPVVIFLGGEVNRPGLYKLNHAEIKKTESIPSFSGDILNPQTNYLNYSGSSAPKLFDAMQRGQGITSNADLSNILVTRKTINKGETRIIQAKINLIDLLEKGDQDQNINLLDGDSIFVPRSENIILDQLIAINRTNLTPEYIEVFINGNVAKPGKTITRQNSSLIEALASAGGELSNTGNIHFLRLKRNGKTEKRILNYDNESEKGSFNNPILISGDIIIVKRNILGKTTEAIDNVASPILSGYGLYKLFD